jgi:hypothetical protein
MRHFGLAVGDTAYSSHPSPPDVPASAFTFRCGHLRFTGAGEGMVRREKMGWHLHLLGLFVWVTSSKNGGVRGKPDGTI